MSRAASRKATDEPAPSYVWKEGGGEFRKHNAAVVHAALEGVRSKYGALSPALVVQEAKRKTSPLHSIVYAATDAEAARMGREAIASRLIRSLRVVVITPEREEINVRAFISRPAEGSGKTRSYLSTIEEMGSEEGRAVMLRQAWLELRAFKRKYAALSEFAMVFDAMDRLEVKKPVRRKVG